MRQDVRLTSCVATVAVIAIVAFAFPIALTGPSAAVPEAVPQDDAASVLEAGERLPPRPERTAEERTRLAAELREV